MDVAERATDPGVDGGADLVVLALPADSSYLSVLRTATAGLAARLHFTLDEIEDLRIAVDEACALLLAAARADSELECRFTVGSDRIGVAISVPSDRPMLPRRDTFAWSVLSALAGEVDAAVSGRTVTIRLVKRRGGSL